MRNLFFVLLFLVIVLEIVFAMFWPPGLWSLILFLPLALIGLRDVSNTRQTIRKNFPILGNMRYLLESIRPEIMQYFVETDTEGRPFNRIFRSLVYQRAKKQTDTTPFGTQSDVYRSGY
ncbi:MAG: FMN-binding glutamate synthase family protein, partial [Bacteroidota bacterium]